MSESLAFIDVLAARQLIKRHIRRTPLIYSAYLSERSGAEVWLKPENLQPTGSFKVRGALNKLGQLAARGVRDRLVTASAGNHGLGLAYAAGRLGGWPVDIFVPVDAPQSKIEKLRRFAVTLHLAGQSYDESHEIAAAFAREHQALEIPAYDDLEVMAGQATIGLEIMTALPEIDVLLVPVGGGALSAGTAFVVKQLKPAVQVMGLQPEASPAALLSFRDGRAYESYAHEPTIADGLAGGYGRLTFEVGRAVIDQIWLASEIELRRAIYTLVDKEQLIVEASGAISITPLLGERKDLAGRTVVCVLSGGNLDTALLAELLNE